MHPGIRAALLAATIPALALSQISPKDVTLSPITSVKIERLAALEFPWGMAYLPDGRLLITEKPGRLRIFADGKLSAPIENVPATAFRPKPGEQGGVLDVAVDPEFEQNRFIYLSYSELAPQPSPQQIGRAHV